MKKNNDVINMEQTTFIQRHAKKILLVGGVVVAAGAYYLLHKHGLEINDFKEKIEMDGRTIDHLINELDQVTEDNHTLMAAASEGLFEEALATTVRKLNSRKDRFEYLNNLEDKTPEVLEKIKMLASEIDVLEIRKIRFTKAQALMEIKDLD